MSNGVVNMPKESLGGFDIEDYWRRFELIYVGLGNTSVVEINLEERFFEITMSISFVWSGLCYEIKPFNDGFSRFKQKMANHFFSTIEDFEAHRLDSFQQWLKDLMLPTHFVTWGEDNGCITCAIKMRLIFKQPIPLLKTVQIYTLQSVLYNKRILSLRDDLENLIYSRAHGFAIDIAGLDSGKILRAMCARACELVRTSHFKKENIPTIQQAKELINSNRFIIVCNGIPIETDFSSVDRIYPAGFDRLYGKGSLGQVITSLRKHEAVEDNLNAKRTKLI